MLCSFTCLAKILSMSLCVCMPAQSCPTLYDPIDCGPPVSSVHGIFQARKLKWVAISYYRWSSWPRDRTRISCVFCIGSRVLNHCSTWEAWMSLCVCMQLFSRMYTKEWNCRVIRNVPFQVYLLLHFCWQQMREERSHCFLFSPTLAIVRFKFCCQFEDYASISQCVIIWISLITSKSEHVVIYLLAIWFFITVEFWSIAFARNSLEVQWLELRAFTTEGVGSLRSHKPHSMAKNK